MGLFEARVKIGAMKDGKPDFTEEVELLVDTGATYSTISRTVLTRLGVAPIGTVPVRLANGAWIEKQFGVAAIAVGGRIAVGNVLMGDDGDFSLLGATTLELASLAVDPVGKRLVAVSAIQASARV